MTSLYFVNVVIIVSKLRASIEKYVRFENLCVMTREFLVAVAKS